MVLCIFMDMQKLVAYICQLSRSLLVRARILSHYWNFCLFEATILSTCVLTSCLKDSLFSLFEINRSWVLPLCCSWLLCFYFRMAEPRFNNPYFWPPPPAMPGQVSDTASTVATIGCLNVTLMQITALHVNADLYLFVLSMMHDVCRKR